jgi:uncharacterized protein YjiS (DUF1127 family)
MIAITLSRRGSPVVGSPSLGDRTMRIIRAARTLFERYVAMRQTWRARQYERNYLATASELDLRNMGLTLIDARREAGKPFWAP